MHFTAPELPGVGVEPFPGQVPQGDWPPCYQEYRQTSTAATVYSGTVKSEAIKIQAVQGVNAVRLLEALKAGVANAGYSVNEDEPQTIVRDQVTVNLAPKPSGEYTYTHRIIAKIQSGAGQVAIDVSSTAYRDVGGRRVYYTTPEEVPRQVFLKIQAALTGS